MKKTLNIVIILACMVLGTSQAQAQDAPSHVEKRLQQQSQVEAINKARFMRRAMEAGTWVMPMVMYQRLAQGAFESFGGDELTIFYYSQPMNWQARMVTGNNNSPYVHTYHDLSKSGPVVIEVPPATEDNAFFGTFLDAWHKPILDVGPDGADGGKGGKYLLVPEEYKGNTDGYIVVEHATNKGYLSVRSLTKTTSAADMKKHQAYVKQLKMYKLGDSSSKTKIIDLYGKTYYATINFDITFWEDAHAMIQSEPVKADEKAFLRNDEISGYRKRQTVQTQ